MGSCIRTIWRIRLTEASFPLFRQHLKCEGWIIGEQAIYTEFKQASDVFCLIGGVGVYPPPGCMFLTDHPGGNTAHRRIQGFKPDEPGNNDALQASWESG